MREPIAARPFTDASPKRRQQAERERNAADDLAAARARRLWRRARSANDSHAFLVSKGLKRHEVRQFRNVLIVPVVNANEDLVSLHLIAADGTQRFLKGSRVAGGFYVLGGDAATAPTIVITEGFAAAARI